MKYLLLIHHNPAVFEAMSDKDRDAIMAEVDKIMAELAGSGEWVGGQALADPAKTRTVRVQGGQPVIADGPFAEAKEALAGYLIVDVESEERAVEIAASWPDARFGAMEVREIMHTAGTEM